jgi:2-polyprenyl-3-methyl-5-hydroxy-6-metoxy-1,4-benzoquinol methylase
VTTTTAPGTTIDEERIGAFAGRLMEAGVAAFELATIDLGRSLGLYQALCDHGPVTAGSLAAIAGIDVRYAREWLEQQAVAGIIDVATEDPDDEARRYALAPEHASVLVDADSPAYLGPMSEFAASFGRVMEHLRTAFRTGGGVPFAAYGIHDAQAAMNRPMFLQQLDSEWLPAVPGLVDRLSAPGAAVFELGCGEGWAAIALATAFPAVTVLAVDTDEASISAARRAAADAGVADRVRFEVCDASDPIATEHREAFDLVCAFEMLHDVSNPVGVLAGARAAAKPGGTILVADERVPDEFTAPGELLDRFFYGASVLHCLPAGMADQPSAATGTVLRRSTLERYAADAGCSGVEVLPIEHDFFRFYLIRL